MTRLKLYIASKISQADRWKALEPHWPEIKLVSRWIKLHVGNTPDDPAFAKIFWQHDHEDVQACDVLLLFAEDGEHLRGGLVEAGMALALGKPVICVGDHPDYGTWQWHAQVFRVINLDEARILLRCLAM